MYVCVFVMIKQVLITDGLPLTVCIDCCVLLNQCSEFIEKTNQAQISLRQLLINPKSEPQPVEPNIDYVEETVGYPKDESTNKEGIVECQLSANYINQTDTITNASYFIEECKNENSQKYESQEMQDSAKQKKCKIQIKKSSPKQTKKRLKKKSQMQKMEEESELYISSKDIEKEQDNVIAKNNMDVIDNYMPGRCMIPRKDIKLVFIL